MTRRWRVAAAIARAACRKRRTPDQLLPETSGAWKRGVVEEIAAAGNDVIPAAGVRRTLQARYTGGGTVEVTLYELASSAAALDAVQRWRPAADTVFFYRDEFFVVLKFQSADRKLLQALVRDLDRNLAPPK